MVLGQLHGPCYTLVVLWIKTYEVVSGYCACHLSPVALEMISPPSFVVKNK